MKKEKTQVKKIIVIISTCIMVLSISDIVLYPIFRDVETMNAYYQNTLLCTKEEI
jgi:hypothetical protein